MIQLLWTGEYLIFVLLILALVLSLTIHELGHAVVAKWFGDDTAQRAGRITLNPIAHIDPMGLMMVIIVGFGFAKPVPTNPANFTSPQADLWVAAAGPAMNLLLAVGCWNLYILAWHAGWTTPPVEIFFTLLAQINLLLMIFNLLPIGPLTVTTLHRTCCRREPLGCIATTTHASGPWCCWAWWSGACWDCRCSVGYRSCRGRC